MRWRNGKEGKRNKKEASRSSEDVIHWSATRSRARARCVFFVRLRAAMCSAMRSVHRIVNHRVLHVRRTAESAGNTLLYSKLQSAIFPLRNVPFGFPCSCHGVLAKSILLASLSFARVRAPRRQPGASTPTISFLILDLGKGRPILKSLQLLLPEWYEY